MPKRLWNITFCDSDDDIALAHQTDYTASHSFLQSCRLSTQQFFSLSPRRRPSISIKSTSGATGMANLAVQMRTCRR